MDEWKEWFIEYQVDSALALLFRQLKRSEWQERLKMPLLKLARLAKQLYPEEFDWNRRNDE